MGGSGWLWKARVWKPALVPIISPCLARACPEDPCFLRFLCSKGLGVESLVQGKERGRGRGQGRGSSGWLGEVGEGTGECSGLEFPKELHLEPGGHTPGLRIRVS